jgi:PAP2 superfamily
LRRMRWLATGLLIVVAAALTLSRGFYDQTGKDLFFSLTLASTVIVFLHVRPSREALQLTIATSLLVLLQTLALKVSPSPMPVLALLGVGGLGLLACRGIWSTGEESRLLYYAFFPPLLFVLLGYASSALLEITGRLHPRTLDLFLCGFDASLGVQPSFQLGKLVLRSHLFTRIALLFYYALPLPVMLVYAQQLVRWGKGAMAAFLGFFLVGPAGVIFYNLVPACGPVYMFGLRFPFDPLANQQVNQMLMQPVFVSGIRNAFPSLHMAWALLAWWYGKGLPPWTRSLLGMFVAGTSLATLGLGEHYFVDLVVAFPFALMIRAACVAGVPLGDQLRFLAFFSGSLWMVAWVGIVRFGLGIMRVSPLIPWTLVVATLLSSIVLQSRLSDGGSSVKAGSP